MTDVPFVSVMNGALLYYVRWAKRGRTRDLALGSGLATMAFLIRQLGAALAGVPLGYLLLVRLSGCPRRALPWGQRLCLLLPFLGVGLTLWWITAVHGETRVYLEKTQGLRFVWLVSGWDYLRELLPILLHLGLVCWPLAWAIVARLSRQALGWAIGSIAALSGLFLWRTGALPQPLGGILSWDELGLARTLLAGPHPSRPVPGWSQGVVLGVALSTAVVLVATLGEGLRRWTHGRPGPDMVLLLNGLLQLLLLESLWLFHDRYYLPLLPGVIALLVRFLPLTPRGIALTVAGAVLWGTIALTGTIDMFRYIAAVAAAHTWLREQGVTAAHIDAGYAFNGWWLYAPALPSGRGPEPDVPFVTGMTPLPYKIANAPVPPYGVVRRVTWPALWAASDTLYVLEHTAVTAQWGLPSLRREDREPP
jgi:hypothetical protein